VTSTRVTGGDVLAFDPSTLNGWGPQEILINRVWVRNFFGGYAVNTAGGSYAIEHCTESGTIATCTTTTRNTYRVGTTVSALGNSVSGYNASYAPITAVTPTSVSFTARSGLGTGIGGEVTTDGGLWGSTIENSQLAGGINLTPSTADSILIFHNALCCKNPAVTINGRPRSAQITILNNNITNAGGGVYIRGYANQTKMLFNQMEQCDGGDCKVPSTEPDSAMIDIDGSSGNYTTDSAVIEGNNLNPHGEARYAIRLNRAANTEIQNNVISVNQPGGAGIYLTANARNTSIGPNSIQVAGGAAKVSDQDTAHSST
jgi:hypothetical protein